MLESIQSLKVLYHAGDAPLWLRSAIAVWHMAVESWQGMDFLFNPFLYIVLAGVMLLESRMPAVDNQRRLSAGFRQDLFWFVGDRFVWLGALALLGRSVHLLYESHLSFLSVDVGSHLPTAVRIAFVLLAYDLFWWVVHYLKHKVWWLWVFHAVHHSQPEMNLLTDFRVHAGERAINLLLLFIPLSMFHISQPTSFYIAAVLDWYRVIYHANIKTNYGPLKYILVTPQFHRVHHSRERQHAGTNFGVIFTFWDRLFGCHWNNYEQYPVTGIVDDSFPFEQSSKNGAIGTWAQQTAHPFLRLLRSATRVSEPAVEDAKLLVQSAMGGLRLQIETLLDLRKRPAQQDIVRRR